MKILLKGTVVSVALAFSSHAAQLLNIDYGAHLNPAFSVKTGPAATGFSQNDYWNLYSRDGTTQFDWLANGSLANMKWSDGSPSGVNLDVSNAPGAWYTFNSDAMMQSYLYPFDTSRPITSHLTELPGGTYDFYVYAHGQPGAENGVIQLSNGAVDQGTQNTTTNPNWASEPWTEGVQYVLFPGVKVGPGGSVDILSLPGSTGLPVINGIQILQTSAAVPEAGATTAAGMIVFIVGLTCYYTKRQVIT